MLDGQHLLLGYAFSVTAIQRVQCIAAQGEFSQAPVLNQYAQHAELRSAGGKLLTIDYADTPPSVYLGKAVELDTLKLTGLKESSSATLQGRQFSCPNCASPIEVKLETSKAITCASCYSIIDLSQGIGGELRLAVQDEPMRPQIALGTMGKFEGKSWQVVGYHHRVGTPMDIDEDAESFGWEEYLLYNAKAGFQFLCDTTEGWSLVRPATGAPTGKNGKDVSYLGATYRLKDTYTSQTDYVAGEFYWPVKRDYKTFNQDYASGAMRLNREQVGQEVTWSIGSRLGHQTVMQAFGIKDEQAALFKRDAAPTSLPLDKIITWMAVGFMLLILIPSLTRCDSRRDCQNQFNPDSSLSAQEQYEQCQRSSRSGSGGGSYGGYSSGGGGHK
jgi:uncharacterized membrane protein YgcG